MTDALNTTADFATHHIEGYAHQAVARGVRADFKVPLITEIAPNLWMGGVRDGVELPPGIGIEYVFALYQGERYKLADGVKRLDVRMLDSSDVPDASTLVELARSISAARAKAPVLIHCQAGLNRSSLITALVLMLDGDVESAREAIDLIRAKRHEVCLCNEAFEGWLLEWDQQPIEPTPGEIEDAEGGHGQERVCVRCGCTDDRACTNIRTNDGCAWAKPGLCTACVVGVNEADWERPATIGGDDV